METVPACGKIMSKDRTNHAQRSDLPQDYLAIK